MAPSNAASESMLEGLAFLSGAEAPAEHWVRAILTDDFTYEDRRTGLSFPDADADSFPKVVVSMWQTGAPGQPRFEPETLAVRGDRFAAVAVRTVYGNGMVLETINVIGLDATLRLRQRQVNFDRDDVDGAIAELDRLHRHADSF